MRIVSPSGASKTKIMSSFVMLAQHLSNCIHLCPQQYVTTMAHEIGHNWGAGHDDVNNKTCVKSDLAGGKYLMYYTANLGTLPNNHKFSPCSIDAIYRNLIFSVGFDIEINK